MRTYEVHAYVPGVGNIALRIVAYDSGAAQRALLSQYPNAQIGLVRQVD